MTRYSTGESYLSKKSFSARFRRMLPIVIDVETSGLNPQTDALLELAAVPLLMDPTGKLSPDQGFTYQIEAFNGARIDPQSLIITGIDLDQPLRYAIPEQQALQNLFRRIRELLTKYSCERAILVGHNAWFDLAFIQAAIARCQIQNNPFHSFASIDTSTLALVNLGENVLARAMKAVNIYFDVNLAHSALYDAQKTAELFCYLVNQR
jgi:ribonuclease T